MPEHMESVEDLLVRTIKHGAPLYNRGNKKACFDIYMDAAKHACMSEKLVQSDIGELLQQAMDEAMPLGKAGNYDEGAWVLRRCFDQILADPDPPKKRAIHRHQSAIRLIETDGEDESTSDGYWQDEMVKNTTDAEHAQCLADIFSILLTSVKPVSHTRFTKTYDNCFEATELVTSLVRHGLVANRQMGSMKGNMLKQAGFVHSVSHPNEATFVDGTRLYTFASLEELKQKFKEMDSKAEPLVGGDASINRLALKSFLETQMIDADDTARSARRSNPVWISESMDSEREEGAKLANWTQQIEAVVDVGDRKHNFKTYPSCFVGSDAVTAVVEKTDIEMVSDRSHAVTLLNTMTKAGLIYHVTREHDFEDKKLFYRFASHKELQKVMDTFHSLSRAPVGAELVGYNAVVARLRQFAKLDISDILNSFYGCKEGGQECWDIVDLQTWRNNMKRWGFGRRSDQDDVMVDKLSALLINIDPDTWRPPSEDWWSPWGILAQIAIFDQVPRSAFRGTSEAFKWDDLAIKATKVAIERGYFENAYKSTLNQFVVLLPFEHSEAWEDQKQGVNLLLKLLSTVAIQDQDLTDYEIVKRLEFSKRLTTAFLEHAQVIAKFKRFPHRNRAHSRTTTLEERIWLASDLVPRWAKSQQHPDDPSNKDGESPTRNLLKLPVIPLKRLTRG